MIKFEYDRNDKEWDINGRIKKGLLYSTIKLQGDIKARTPVDTGNLKGSILRSIYMRKNTSVGIIGTNVDYAGYVNSGTGPHKKSTGSADFIANIKDWARRHGIDNPWGVITSIRKKGTKKTEFMDLTTRDRTNAIRAFNKGFKV
jgi:hypothetical protein